MTYHLLLGDFLGCKKTYIIFPLLFFCLFSCASTGTRADLPYTWLTNSKKFTLLPPHDIEAPFDSQQIISASYGGRDYQFTAWVKADETGLEMTLVNDLGASMGELSYRDGTLSFSSTVFPASLKPEYIVADFQLCFYNAGKLRLTLEKQGLSLEDTGSARRVLNGNTAIIEIEKKPNSVKFVNNLRGYAYTIEGSI